MEWKLFYRIKRFKSFPTAMMAKRLSSGLSKVTGRLIWIDCEMTGLDVNVNRIVEIACIVTEADLSIVSEGPDLVINQPEDVLSNMSDWCKTTFKMNGLTERIRASNINTENAESQVLTFLKRHTEAGQSVLAGNSVYMDRIFINKYMPNLGAHLHYRTVDVSTVKELVKRWNPLAYTLIPRKKNAHRALDDIKESIEELKWYKANIFKCDNFVT
ncbi:unnamed protein product [Anisakis simplex]|uniref:Probable oligoribonuclease n=1 Tax=Anisakis simplex TaxID=6269 RepID=A0A0M3IY33_ANISI|nr:unnamed protein product [Anisakis simplex]